MLRDDVRPRRPFDCTPYSPWEGEPSCYDGLFEHGHAFSYHDENGELPPETFELWIWETPMLQLLYRDTLNAQYEWQPQEEWDDDSIECLHADVTVTIQSDED